MKLGEMLVQIDENKTVIVTDLVNMEIARYDGRDSIPEEMNDLEVYSQRISTNGNIAIKVKTIRTKMQWTLFVLSYTDYDQLVAYMVPKDMLLEVQKAADKMQNNVIIFDRELQKRKIPYQFIGLFEIPLKDRKETWFDMEIARAEI